MRPLLVAFSLACAATALAPAPARASWARRPTLGSSARDEEGAALAPETSGFVRLLQYAYNKQNPRPLSRPGMPEPKTNWAKPLPRTPGSLAARYQHRSASRVFSEPVLLGFVALAIVPLGALWVAALADVPAAGLVLLLAVVAGPASGWLDPDALLGNLLLPLLSIAVALLVFRAALRLRFAEFDVIGRTGLRLGAASTAVTWPIASAAAFFLLRLDVSLALLLGAVAAMAAPSPRFPGAGRDVDAVLASEGCLLDIAGATVIVCVLEGILFLTAGYRQDVVSVLVNLLWVGGVVGLAGAAFVVTAVKQRWIPPALADGVILLVVLAVFAGSMMLQEDAGFLAVAVMGLALANQDAVRFRSQAMESAPLRAWLQLLLLLLLVARLRFAGVAQVGVTGGAFVLLLVFVVRPLVVGMATWGLDVEWAERLVLAWTAPRGLLAVAVGTLCMLRLADARVPAAESLVPLLVVLLAATILVDIGSHVLAGHTAKNQAAVSGEEPAVAGRTR